MPLATCQRKTLPQSTNGKHGAGLTELPGELDVLPEVRHRQHRRHDQERRSGTPPTVIWPWRLAVRAVTGASVCRCGAIVGAHSPARDDESGEPVRIKVLDSARDVPEEHHPTYREPT